MSWSFNYIAITNNPEQAKALSSCGIQQIMIDIEIIGKVERQGHKDTIISDHSLSDISLLKNHNLDSDVICRVNPYYDGSFKEIDTAIDNGADLIMIPMITEIDNYKSMVDRIGDRVEVIPLIETPYSLFKLPEILDYSKLNQIHFGLNDLCISLGMKNLFEVLLSVTFQNSIKNVEVQIKGVGGIGDPQVGQKVSPMALLNSYMKCNSNSVILSRNFFMNCVDNDYIIRSLNIFEKCIVKGYNPQLDHDLYSQVQKM